MSDELPDGWADVVLAEVAECQLGKMLDKSNQDNGDFLPYLRNINVRWGYVALGDLLKMPFSDQEKEKFSIRDGDILVCEGGEPGRAAIWDHGATEIKFQKALHRVRPANGVLPQLIAYRLRHDATTGVLADYLTGSTIKHFPGEALARYRLPLPPSAEQHRIVEKIDALFARSTRARDELARIPRLIEHYRQAVLEAAFRGELTADWRASYSDIDPATKLVAERQRIAEEGAQNSGIGRDVKSAMLIPDRDLLREIDNLAAAEPLPPTWTWAGIGQVFAVYVGATPSRKVPRYWTGNIPWVSSGEVAFTRIRDTNEKITADGLANASTRLHPKGTVLLGMIGEGKTRGQAAILDIAACNNQNCAAIRVSEARYPPEYLYWNLFCVYKKTRTVGSGNGPQALNKDKVQRLLFPLAPPDEAVEIVKVIEARLRPLEVIEREVNRVQVLSARLDEKVLEKAFAGALVPHDAADEPAAALLERIRAGRIGVPTRQRQRQKQA